MANKPKFFYHNILEMNINQQIIYFQIYFHYPNYRKKNDYFIKIIVYINSYCCNLFPML